MSTDDLRDLADYFGDGGWEWADGEPFDGAGAVARVQQRVKEAEAERDNLGATLQKLANEADLYASGKLREHTERLMSVAASLRAYVERNCEATDEATLHLSMAESAILRARDALEGHE